MLREIPVKVCNYAILWLFIQFYEIIPANFGWVDEFQKEFMVSNKFDENDILLVQTFICFCPFIGTFISWRGNLRILNHVFCWIKTIIWLCSLLGSCPRNCESSSCFVFSRFAFVSHCADTPGQNGENEEADPGMLGDEHGPTDCQHVVGPYFYLVELAPGRR